MRLWGEESLVWDTSSDEGPPSLRRELTDRVRAGSSDIEPSDELRGGGDEEEGVVVDSLHSHSRSG